MDNSINNVSFKATLKPLSKIDNKSAFIEVARLFKEGTKKYSGDSFVLTGIRNDSILYINSPKAADISEEFYMDNINELLANMSPKDVAKKLINVYNALKYHQEETEAMRVLRAGISRAKALLKQNISVATACKNNGKDSIAARYQVLAKNNEAKIDTLRTELAVRTDYFNSKILDMAKTDKDMKQLKICYAG